MLSSDSRLNILVGAPRANTSDQTPSVVTERGAVFSCPWHKSGTCTQLEFDSTGKTQHCAFSHHNVIFAPPCCYLKLFLCIDSHCMLAEEVGFVRVIIGPSE